MIITDVIQPASTRLDLTASSKPELLRTLARLAAKATALAEDMIFDALRAREALGSTGIGNGIALPHASLQKLTSPFTLAAKLRVPVDFDAIDGKAVDIVVLQLVPDRAGQTHVDRLACVAKQLRSVDVQSRVRAARSPKQLYDAFVSDAP